MKKVLIDACGWVAVIDAGINIDQSLIQICGYNQLATTSKVIQELEALDRKGLLLDMLIQKAELIDVSKHSGNHTDDQLIDISKNNNWPILTVDTELKKRLSVEGLEWIEVSGRSHLKFVG
ncbi:MAG: hypothetical protein QGI21_00310 [Candidatus Poseidoniaceae archaeon]|jgi:rRNA-processing protein FCF1|nr:hypothetical protein [Candidatus Poseidoniaceae archaeon]